MSRQQTAIQITQAIKGRSEMMSCFHLPFLGVTILIWKNIMITIEFKVDGHPGTWHNCHCRWQEWGYTVSSQQLSYRVLGATSAQVSERFDWWITIEMDQSNLSDSWKKLDLREWTQTSWAVRFSARAVSVSFCSMLPVLQTTTERIVCRNIFTLLWWDFLVADWLKPQQAKVYNCRVSTKIFAGVVQDFLLDETFNQRPLSRGFPLSRVDVM